MAFNGTQIKTNKQSPDTEGDGLKDGEEITVSIVRKGNRAVIRGKYNSDPTRSDTDDDGLYDGTAQYVRGYVKVAPKDPDNFNKNGDKEL